MPTSETNQPPQDEPANAFVQADPDWLGHAFLDQVRIGLEHLRHYIEDPDENRIPGGTPEAKLPSWPCWNFPFVELTYPVEWNFEEDGHWGHLVSGTKKAVMDASNSERSIRFFFGEDPSVLHEHRQLELLSRLTRRVVEWREAGKTDDIYCPSYILPHDLAAWLDETTGTAVTEKGVEGPPDAVEARRRLVDHLARPFSVGGLETEAAVADAFEELKKDRPNIPPLNFTATSDAGETLEWSVIALLYPLVVDADARRAWFTLAVGLVFTKGDPRLFPEKDLAELWECLTKPDAGETPTSETSTLSATSTKPTINAGPPSPRVATLLDQHTRLDTRVAKVLGFLSGTLWPRKWEKVRKWDDLVQEEVDRLRTEHGDGAFVEAPGRGPLLCRKYTGAGEQLLELTGEAEEALLDRAGPRGFRRVMKNEDGLEAEYLVKRWRAGSGYMQVRFAWYGRAWLLVGEALKAEEDRLLAERRRGPLLFDELNQDAKDDVDTRLAFLGTLADARKVGDYLLRCFGAEGLNPVRIPAHELRRLLQCEMSEKGHRRVEGAIEALRRLDFGYDAARVGRDWSGKTRGYFVSSWSYEGRGAGKHTDGTFWVTFSDMGLGCLRLFQVSGDKVKNVGEVFRFDFTKKLESKDDKEKLDYIRGFSTLVPYFDKAAGLTLHQEHLLRYIEAELTVNKDGTAKGRGPLRTKPAVTNANEPRLYDASFCPLLEKGRHYCGALGHHGNNAEHGRRLKGRAQSRTRSGGAKAGGLLDQMGYDLLPGRADAARTATVEAALKDMKAVVEEALGGVVAAKKGGEWLNLEEAVKLPVGELLEGVSWFLFLAEDFRERMVAAIERHHQDRYDRGETDSVVRITKDRAEYKKAQEDRGGTVEEVRVGLSELRHRMRAARMDRGLTLAQVGAVFGVSKMTISNWERGLEYCGAAIPADLRPLVLRWVEKNEGPTEEELKALSARRRGGKHH